MTPMHLGTITVTLEIAEDGKRRTRVGSDGDLSVIESLGMLRLAEDVLLNLDAYDDYDGEDE